MKKVSFHTFGCKLNQAETSAIADQFAKEGYQIVEFGEPADVSVIHTCTVTERADQKARQTIRKASKLSPDGKVVVVGCYAQMAPEEISKINGVDLVLGNAEKFRALEFLENLPPLQEIPLVRTNGLYDHSIFQDAKTENTHGHTRAMLKIQDGCDFNCSFCIIPFARGSSKSREYRNIIHQTHTLIQNGYKEIVLTGVNIGYYGYQSGERGALKRLLKDLDEMEGLERIRISSIEPNTVDEEMLEIMANSRTICSHFHLPLQSASDDILQGMKRRYTLKKYQALVEKISQRWTCFGLGTDVIVGFPGETDARFKETYDFIERMPYSYVHVFNYSRRRGTEADGLIDQIPNKVREERSQILRKLAIQKKLNFARRHIGTVEPILVEEKTDQGLQSGFTKDYLKVFIPAREDISNQFVPVQITGTWKEFAVGEIVF
jgi:threonylcarbamoyladenosine tRNA methylthiotransferase MtaB